MKHVVPAFVAIAVLLVADPFQESRDFRFGETQTSAGPRRWGSVDHPLPRFASLDELTHWAAQSLGGASTSPMLAYRGRELVVAFRVHTSGVATSEPFVFLEEAGAWHCILHAATVDAEMEASIQRDTLILWRLDGLDGSMQRREVLRLSLIDLEPASLSASAPASRPRR